MKFERHSPKAHVQALGLTFLRGASAQRALSTGDGESAAFAWDIGSWFPAVIIAAGILGYYTFQTSSRQYAQLGEETIAQTLLVGGPAAASEEVERYIRVTLTTTCIGWSTRTILGTIDSVWLPAAAGRDSERAIGSPRRSRWKWSFNGRARDDRKSASRFLASVSTTPRASSLDLDVDGPERIS